MRLKDKRLWVIGSSAGLGRASGLALAAEGARVCFSARRAERIEEAAAEAGNGAITQVVDVRDEVSCREAAASVVERLGGLDGIVYSPGIATFGPIEEIDAKAWHDVLNTNLLGVTYVLNAAIGPLEASRGRAVVISSIVIDDSPPRPQQATYVVSKRALEALVECWQNEHRKVGFTSIACGDTMSEFGFGHDIEKLMPIVQRWGELEYTYGRLMEAEAIAEQVVNALAARETLRRIAVTPIYPEGVAEGTSESEIDFMVGRTEK